MFRACHLPIIIRKIYALPNFFSSVPANKIARNAAIKSAMGAEYITPRIPMNIGRISSRGSKNIICLVRDKKIPLAAFPMDVKKLETIGWIPLIKVKNRNIRKYSSANW